MNRNGSARNWSPREVVASGLAVLAVWSAVVLGLQIPDPGMRIGSPIEIAQDIILLSGFVTCLSLAASPKVRSIPWALGWMLLVSALFLVILGNEVHWGRRVFSWRVINDAWPHGWTRDINLRPLAPTKINRPRALTMMTVAVGAIGYPIVGVVKGPRWLGLPAWFAPAAGGIPWAAAVAITGAIALLVGGPTVFGLSRFQFGEVQLLFTYLFLLNYALARRDLLHRKPLA